MTRDPDSPGDVPPRPRPPRPAAEDRRAAALRANLARRKAQARSRAGIDDSAAGPDPADPESED